MIRRHHLALRVLAVILAAACSSSSDVFGPPISRGDEAIQTDSLAYTAVGAAGAELGQYRVRVIARYTNQWTAPVFLARCFPTSPSPIYGVQVVGDTSGTGPYGSAFDPS